MDVIVVLFKGIRTYSFVRIAGFCNFQVSLLLLSEISRCFLPMNRFQGSLLTIYCVQSWSGAWDSWAPPFALGIHRIANLCPFDILLCSLEMQVRAAVTFCENSGSSNYKNTLQRPLFASHLSTGIYPQYSPGKSHVGKI